ncbi:NAD(P)/FAD-dependent oxidoreductase [Enterococcus songbeiensis]
MGKSFDVIVVGAGPSGMMAAISAAENGAKVLLIEKNKKLGRKLLLTGGGRCNVTNNRDVADLITHIPGNGKFLYSTFSQWNNLDIMNFFESNGVHLKEEDHGRMFPVTDRSKTIVDALATKMQELGVTVVTNTAAKKLLHDGKQITGLRTEYEDFQSSCVILTTGGRTYPSTGATGDGYQLAKKVGHTITPLFPTESPLISEDSFIQEKRLQGLSLQDIECSIVDEQQKLIVTHKMDLLFTHFGLSGPAALRCSFFVNQLLKKQDSVTAVIDCLPDVTKDELTAEMQKLTTGSKKSLKNALQNFLPERLLQFFLEQTKLEQVTAEKAILEQLSHLAEQIKHFSVQITKTFPLEKSFVTGGGVQLTEVNPKTLESKQIEGLFFAGELLDVNGYTGGFNITAAFCTGHVAGAHAAEIAAYSY